MELNTKKQKKTVELFQDVLVQAFNFLEFKDLLVAEKVSLLWKKSVNLPIIWKNRLVTLESQDYESKSAHLAQFYTHVTSYVVPYSLQISKNLKMLVLKEKLNYEVLETILSKNLDLEMLELNFHSEEKFSDFTLKTFKFPKLKVLKTSLTNLIPKIETTSLETLEITTLLSQQKYRNDVTKFSLKQPNLKSISVSLEQDQEKQILETLTQLEEIQFHFFHYSYLDLIKKLSHLDSISFVETDINNIEFNELMVLAKEKNIKKLDLGCYEYVLDFQLYCPSIHTLRLAYWDPRWISTCPNLVNLGVVCLSKQYCPLDVIKHFPNLENFEFDYDEYPDLTKKVDFYTGKSFLVMNNVKLLKFYASIRPECIYVLLACCPFLKIDYRVFKGNDFSNISFRDDPYKELEYSLLTSLKSVIGDEKIIYNVEKKIKDSIERVKSSIECGVKDFKNLKEYDLSLFQFLNFIRNCNINNCQ